MDSPPRLRAPPPIRRTWQRLRRFTDVTTTRRIGYRAPKGSCAPCRFRPRCAPLEGNARSTACGNRSWWKQRWSGQPARRASSGSKSGRCGRRVSSPWRKELHGLRRTRFKGRRKVQIQLCLTAAAMNLKRVVQAMSRGTPTVATARAALSAATRWIRRLLSLSHGYLGNRPIWTSTRC